MDYVGLTKDEADHLLVLLEGDISDVEIEESDDEIELEVSSRSNSSNVPPLLETVPYDMIPTEQEFDSEDDLPLSYFQKKPKKKKLKRKKTEKKGGEECRAHKIKQKMQERKEKDQKGEQVEVEKIVSEVVEEVMQEEGENI
ncbi:hypothetical protein RI129_003023 [Pyrocoelia pectoralis]|uniref:Uncharacterized protein n=1 Tax=Pyrocoelia pectoralis TaxID=417401 RepID=A0AAN7VN27_9COLE